MKERIKELISSIGMNQAQFANRVNIQNSTLSHALNGRNEVSKDIIIKIHEAYPTVSINWLMFGEGEMYMNGEPLPPPLPPTAPATAPCDTPQQSSLFTPPVVPPLPTPIVNRPERRVTKIMVFYSDNSFESFSPEG